MTQTELNLGRGEELAAPYNGLFFCHIRGGMFRWRRIYFIF